MTPSSSSSTALVLKPTNAVRSFHGPFDIVCSLVFMTFCSMCFACWGNNICNCYKFGMYRFKYNVDETIIPMDFKVARYVGGLFGLFFWWTLVGPAKYRRSDLEKWTTRVGPF